MTPSTLPATVRRRLAGHAAAAVDEADSEEVIRGLDGGSRRRHARLVTMGALHHDLSAGDRAGLDHAQGAMLRRGIGVLIGAAEDVAHGAVGELTDAGIEAARKAAHCACDEQFIRVLRTILDVVVEGAFAGLRRAAR